MFARHGLRCTPQREEVYLALASTRDHPTAEELYTTVRKRLPEISLGTVYNALTHFSRRGICRRLSGEDGTARFDAETDNHVHVSTDDGRLRDVPEDIGSSVLASIPTELIEDIEKRMGLRIDQVRVEFVARNAGPGAC